MVIQVEQGKGRYTIPTIRDRVAQTAVKLVIEPIFEADRRTKKMAASRDQRPKEGPTLRPVGRSG
jgi:hypothetical protein